MSKIIHVTSILLICMGIIAVPCFGGETSHYVNGVEGIKVATLPPPGIYYRLYNVFYCADEISDKNGHELDLGYKVKVFAMSHRLLWVSEKKFFGATYFANILFPLVDTDIQINAFGIDESKFGIADIFIEPLALTRYGEKYDLSAGIGVFVPNGKYDKDEPASPGKDFWTGMLSFGGTLYFDENKIWAASILNRYEIHSKKGHTDIRAGDDFHFEWGISKRLPKGWELGLTGYCQWQLTDDRGSDVTWDKSVHDRVYAIGPEVGVFFPAWKFAVSLRSQWEFEARDRSEGNVTVLTISKLL